MLFSKLKYSSNTVIQCLGTLRFFYIKALKKNMRNAETPCTRKVIRLTEILSREEVARLIDAADSSFHRAMLMTLCGTGARRTEASHLNVGGIRYKKICTHGLGPQFWSRLMHILIEPLHEESRDASAVILGHHLVAISG